MKKNIYNNLVANSFMINCHTTNDMFVKFIIFTFEHYRVMINALLSDMNLEVLTIVHANCECSHAANLKKQLEI